MKWTARGSLKMQDPKSHQKSPSGHHRTTLSCYIFTTKACIDNRKKNLLSSRISSWRPHTMVNSGPLAAEIGLVVWGTPANFNGFRVLVALLHGTPVVGVSQTLWHWTGGTTCLAGRPSHWSLAHISSCCCYCCCTEWENANMWLGHILRHELLLRDVIEGRVRRNATRGQKRMHLLSDLNKKKEVTRK